MKKKSFEELSGVKITLGVLGGKWKPIILCHLKDKIYRFNELHRSIPSITQKMLTAQLREMEADGLVKRKIFPEIPPHVEYSLTDYGKSLQPVLKAMWEWGETHKKRKS